MLAVCLHMLLRAQHDFHPVSIHMNVHSVASRNIHIYMQHQFIQLLNRIYIFDCKTDAIPKRGRKKNTHQPTEELRRENNNNKRTNEDMGMKIHKNNIQNNKRQIEMEQETIFNLV